MIEPNCQPQATYHIKVPTGHTEVQGTCLHLGAELVEVRDKQEIVAVVFASGTYVVKSGPKPNC